VGDLQEAIAQLPEALNSKGAPAARIVYKPSLDAEPPEDVWLMPWPLWHVAQLVGSLLVYITATVALVPCYYYVQLLLDNRLALGQPWGYIWLSSCPGAPAPGIFGAASGSGLTTFGLLVPLVFPLWMLAMTVQVSWLIGACPSADHALTVSSSRA